MATFQSTVARLVRQPRQRVLVNGVQRHGVFCVEVSEAVGLVAATAQFVLVYEMAGADVEWARDAEVVVYADELREDSGAPVFRGVLSWDTATEDARHSRVFVTGNSWLSYLDRVMCGEKTGQGIYTFLKQDRLTGSSTDVRISSLLEFFFGPAEYPEEWDAKIGLGDISGLLGSPSNLLLDDLVLPCVSYLEMLSTVLGKAPDVVVRQRWGAGKTYLDVLPHGGVGARRVVSFPTADEGPEEGANGTAVVMEGDVDEIYSRAIGHGRPGETMLTVGTDHATAPLVPAWDGASGSANPAADAFVYPSTLPTWVEGDPVSAAEFEVMQCPGKAVEGDPNFKRELVDVWRRFRLPDCLRRLRVLDGNLLEMTYARGDKRKLGVQVFRRVVTFGTGDGFGVSGGDPGAESETEFELIEGARLLPDGDLLLPEPALQCMSYSVDLGTGAMVQQFGPVQIYVTCSVQELDWSGSHYDTGIRGDVRLPGIADTVGLVFGFLNNNVRYQKAGSEAEEFTDSWGGTGHTFGARWFNTLTQAWDSVDGGDPRILRDDQPWLQDLAERALAQRTTRRKSVRATVPRFCPQYRPGDGLVVRNRGMDDKVLTIQATARNLFNPQTIMVASDQVQWSQEMLHSEVPGGAQFDMMLKQARGMGSVPSPPAPLAGGEGRNGMLDGGGNPSPLAEYAKSLELEPSNYKTEAAPDYVRPQSIDPTMGYRP